MHKYKLRYKIEGEIELEAENQLFLMSQFDDRVGFSEDDLYENLDYNFEVVSVEKID